MKKKSIKHIKYGDGGGPPKKQAVYTDWSQYLKAKQAYEDSLNLYKITKDILNPSYYKNPNSPIFGSSFLNKDKENAFLKKHNIQPRSKINSAKDFPGKIKPIDYNWYSEGQYYPIYKEPVQPVIYQKPKPTVTQQQPVKPLPFRAKYSMPDTSANPNMQGEYPLQMFYQPAATQAEADSIEQAMNKKRIELQNYMRNLPKKATGGMVNDNPLEVYGKGGYTVTRSSERKGKTHKVTGPDGSVKYFGDPNMGERGKSKYGKEAFYARHAKNLKNNPHFRAYARATWANGGMLPIEDFDYGPTEDIVLEAYGQGGEMIKRADGSYSRRGLWDNIRANRGSGKKPTKEMLKQERKIKAEYAMGGEYEAISMAEGGIHIKPENRGKFTAWAKSKGMGVQEAASHVLANKERYSPTVVKRANFAHNAAKWKHAEGGYMPQYANGTPFTTNQEDFRFYNYGQPEMMVPEPTEEMVMTPAGRFRFSDYRQPQTPLSVAPKELNKSDFFYANQADVRTNKPTPITTTPPSNLKERETEGSDMYNPSLAGVMTQIGSGIIGTGAQLRNINRLKAPGVVPRVNFTPMGSPALVDMGAQLSDIDRSYREGQEMINREIGSGAGKVANLAKLQAAKLAGKGQVLQAEETANTQIKNQFLQMRNEMKMREQAANQQAALEDIANRYGYDLTTTQGRNAAIATLTNLVSQAGGAYTGLESQKLGLSGLSKAYTPGLAARQGLKEMEDAYFKKNKKQDGER